MRAGEEENDGVVEFNRAQQFASGFIVVNIQIIFDGQR